MSGLEIVSSVASIVQLVDAAIRVASRCIEYADASRNLPENIRDTREDIAMLLLVLWRLKACNITSRNPEISSVVSALERTLKELELKFKKVAPSPTDSKLKIWLKAASSLRYEKDIQQKKTKLANFERKILLFLTIASNASVTVNGNLEIRRKRYTNFIPDGHTDSYEDRIDRGCYNELVSGLLVPRSDAPTAIVHLNIDKLFSMVYFLVKNLWMAKQRDLIVAICFYSDPEWWIQTALYQMEIPFSYKDKFETLWGILVKVIEECKLPWLLVLGIFNWSEKSQHALNWLPRGRNGSVLVYDFCGGSPGMVLPRYTTFIGRKDESRHDEQGPSICSCSWCVEHPDQARIAEVDSDDDDEDSQNLDDESEFDPRITEIQFQNKEAFRLGAHVATLLSTMQL